MSVHIDRRCDLRLYSVSAGQRVETIGLAGSAGSVDPPIPPLTRGNTGVAGDNGRSERYPLFVGHCIS